MNFAFLILSQKSRLFSTDTIVFNFQNQKKFHSLDFQKNDTFVSSVKSQWIITFSAKVYNIIVREKHYVTSTVESP